MSRRPGLWWTVALIAPVGLLVGIVVTTAFGQAGSDAAAGLSPAHSSVLGNTLSYSALTALLSVLLGWALAHCRHSYTFAGRSLLHVGALAGLLMPSFTFAMGLLVLLGHNGLARPVLPPGFDIYGLPGLVASGALARLPYAYLVLDLAYRHLDRRLLETAATLGATRRQVSRRVLMPALGPALGSGFLLVLGDSMADLANPLVIGGGYSVLASRLYEAVDGEGDLVTASVYGVVLLAAALSFFAITRLLRGGHQEGPLPTPRPLRAAGRAGQLLLTLSWLTVGIVVTLLATVATGSVLSPAGRFTWTHYADLLGGRHTRDLATSLLLALVATPIVIGASVALTLVSARSRLGLQRARRLTDVAGAVPVLVLGLGASLVLGRLGRLVPDAAAAPGVLTGVTLLALLVVHVLRNLPATAGATLRGTESLVPTVSDAARTLGARRRDLVAVLVSPQLRRGLLVSALATFARCLTVVSAVILLVGPQTPLLSVRTLIEAQEGRIGAASAMTVALAGLIAAAGVGVRLLDRKAP